MRFTWVLLLCALSVPASATSIIRDDGFGCKTPELWIAFYKAIKKRDDKTIRNIKLSQRCVDIPQGNVEVLERFEDFLKIQGRANRQLYIPKVYVKE